MSDGFLGRLLAGRFDRWPDTINYQSEVDQIAEVGKEHGPVSSVLGFGDSSRRHLELLAAAGFDTAVSESPDRTFDAVIAMGSTIGRQVTDEALAATLATIGQRLRPGGLLLFEVLDGNLVLRHEPRSLFSRASSDDTHFVQAALVSVDYEESALQMQVRLWRLAGERVADQFAETWSIRFFLPRELELVLAINEFELLGTCPLGTEHNGAGGWHRLVWATKPATR